MKVVNLFLILSLIVVSLLIFGCVDKPLCGNGVCEIGETPESCSTDCGQSFMTCSALGGITCTTDETCSTYTLPASDSESCCIQGQCIKEATFCEDYVAGEINVGVKSYEKKNNLIVEKQYDTNVFTVVPDEYIVTFESPSVVDYYLINFNEASEVDSNMVQDALITYEKKIETDKNNVFLQDLNNIEVIEQYSVSSNSALVKITNYNDIESIIANGAVKRIEPNIIFKTTLSNYSSQSSTTYLTEREFNDFNGEGVRVGIIDTGIDYTHSDFGACTFEQYQNKQCDKIQGGVDYIELDGDPMDITGHGTHVAGIIAADSPSFKGVAPKADLFAIRVCNDSGCPLSTILQGIDWAVDPNGDNLFDDKMDIINLSLGGPGYIGDTMSERINSLFDFGILSIVAAGNAGGPNQQIGSPGIAKNALTVGAISNTGELAYFSSRGPVVNYSNEDIILKPEIVAPGVNICSSLSSQSFIGGTTCMDDSHVLMSGTSMATPYVTGVASIIKQANPNSSPAEIRSILINTSNMQDVITSTFHATGAGKINPTIAINSKLLFSQQSAYIPYHEELSVTIENISSSQICFEVEKKSFRNLRREELSAQGYNNLKLTSNTTCLDPTEETQIIIQNNIIDDLYFGNISVLTSDINYYFPLIVGKPRFVDFNLNSITNDKDQCDIFIDNYEVGDNIYNVEFSTACYKESDCTKKLLFPRENSMIMVRAICKSIVNESQDSTIYYYLDPLDSSNDKLDIFNQDFIQATGGTKDFILNNQLSQKYTYHSAGFRDNQNFGYSHQWASFFNDKDCLFTGEQILMLSLGENITSNVTYFAYAQPTTGDINFFDELYIIQDLNFKIPENPIINILNNPFEHLKIITESDSQIGLGGFYSNTTSKVYNISIEANKYTLIEILTSQPRCLMVSPNDYFEIDCSTEETISSTEPHFGVISLD